MPNKTELTTLVDQLETRISNLLRENAEYAEETDRLTSSCDHKDRQTANVSRVFVTLYEEKRTLDLRFGWLEEAACDVVSACPEHQPGLIVKLADELGIELKQEK